MSARLLQGGVFAAAVALCAPTSVRADAPQPMPAREFVQAAAESDQFERVEGQIALVEGRDPRVRAFAQEMISAHAQTTQTLQSAASAAGLPPPSMALSGDQAMLLSALQGQRGQDFDRTYVRQQIMGHASALAVAQTFAQSGSDTPVRRAAAAAVPIIQHHLAEARDLCAALGCGG